MNSADLRRQAREALSGRWSTLAIITLVYSVITSAASSIYIGALIVVGPLTVAMAEISLRVINRRSTGVEDLFLGFRYNFTNNLLLGLVNTLLIALWSLLFIVPGIIKSLSYSMSYYIMADNPGMSHGEARRRSEEMMRGNKMNLFLLELSFIGWIILSAFTLGIGYFFLFPYMQASVAAFYENLKLKSFIDNNFAENYSQGDDNGNGFGNSFDNGDTDEHQHTSDNVFDEYFSGSKNNDGSNTTE